MKGEIQFKKVSLRYPGSERLAVDNVSLTIPPHCTVALAGRSGSGKSTLFELLMRNRDPSAGQVLVDGIDLREIDLQRYRAEGLAVVAQKVELFSGTIADNIRVGKLDASDAEVAQAARDAYVTEYADRLRLGLESLIGEDGITLSGGERQRLALARALVRGASILALDEATSALDNRNERFIKSTLDRMTREKRCTIFMIAHRFTTIRNADIIFVMKEGRLVEQGTHDELLALKGEYWELHEEGGSPGS